MPCRLSECTICRHKRAILPIAPPTSNSPPSVAVEGVPERKDREDFETVGQARAKGEASGLQTYLRLCSLCRSEREATDAIEDIQAFARLKRDNIEEHQRYLQRPNSLMADVARTRLRELQDAKKRSDCETFEQATVAEAKKARDLKCRPELWGADVQGSHRAQCMRMNSEDLAKLSTERASALAVCESDKIDSDALAMALGQPSPLSPSYKRSPAVLLPRPSASIKGCLPLPQEIAQVQQREFALAQLLRTSTLKNKEFRTKADKYLQDAREALAAFELRRWNEISGAKEKKKEDFECYAATFPSASNLETVKEIAEDLKLCESTKAAARATGQKRRQSGFSVSKLQEYLSNTRSGQCKDEIDKLISQERASDRERWSSLSASTQIQDFRRYAEDFPEGEKIEEARTIIADLEACEIAKLEVGATSKRPEASKSSSSTTRRTGMEALKKYLDQARFVRCRSEIAALFAPPSDLNGAQLHIGKLADVSDVKFAQDATSLIVASPMLGNVYRWDLASGHIAPVALLKDPISRKVALRFSPDARYLLEGSESNGLKMRSTADLATVLTIADVNGDSAAWSDSGRHVVGRTIDGKGLGVWDAATGKLTRKVILDRSDADISKLRVSNDAAWLAVRIDWTEKVKRSRADCPSALLFSGDNQREIIDCSTYHHEMQVWNLRSGRVEFRAQPKKEKRQQEVEDENGKKKTTTETVDVAVLDVAFARDGSKAFVLFQEGKVEIRQLPGGAVYGSKARLTSTAANSTFVLPTGEVTLRGNRWFSVWDLSAKGDEPRENYANVPGSRPVEISLDGQTFATTDGKLVWLWDRKAGSARAWLALKRDWRFHRPQSVKWICGVLSGRRKLEPRDWKALMACHYRTLLRVSVPEGSTGSPNPERPEQARDLTTADCG
jgi:WD40 repeat protein